MTTQTLVQQDRAWTLESRRQFHALPLAERRRKLAELAQQTVSSATTASEDHERAVWQGGDIAEE